MGKIADNHINRDFEAIAQNQKWFTDVTEFNGLLKSEMFYDQEEKYKTLKEAIEVT